MNSEISNILKLSPVTVIKADKPTDERLVSAVKEDPTFKAVGSPAVTKSGQQQNKDDKGQKPSLEAVKKAADQGNSLLQFVQRNLQFKVDDSTKELVVKIVDSQSGDVVRQIPSEEMLSFIRRMQELDGQQGSVLQDRA
jgi:flagellar protein FlaG